jgi:hypothetical protein
LINPAAPSHQPVALIRRHLEFLDRQPDCRLLVRLVIDDADEFGRRPAKSGKCSASSSEPQFLGGRSAIAPKIEDHEDDDSLQQQARFDAFVHEFNIERPHEALAMKCPAEVYAASTRPYDGLPDLAYPLHDRDILVTACGRICLNRKKINVSTVLAGHTLGIKEVDEGIWLVSFMHYDLGYFDLEQKTLQPLDNPFGPRLSPMS